MLLAWFIILLLGITSVVAGDAISLTAISTTQSEGDADGEAGAEISAFASFNKQLFTTNAAKNRLDVLDLSDPASPKKLDSIDLSPYGGGINSVAVSSARKLLVAAVEAQNKQEPGSAVFFKLKRNGPAKHFMTVTAGALPDMITFTPNGQYVLVANEGEPSDDYTVDPEGSITIIPITGLRAFKPKTAGFTAFNDKEAELQASGVRIFGPRATVAQDLEPEYITVSANSKTAWVSLQENNALAIVDIPSATVTNIVALGLKDHSLPGNELDASDSDGTINIKNWPVFGMFQPDGISSIQVAGKTYIVSANEGDSRNYDGFSEEKRIKDLSLDGTVFPNGAVLKQNANLGRLKTTNKYQNNSPSGDVKTLYSYGARSFSIWNADGTLVWDSGSEFANITSNQFPTLFNSEGDEDSFDGRSDDKGCEPEGIVTGKVRGRIYVFIGLERIGGIMVYDVTNPFAPEFVEYTRNPGDVSPEGVTFVPAGESPIPGVPLLIVTHEVSSTTTVFKID